MQCSAVDTDVTSPPLMSSLDWQGIGLIKICHQGSDDRSSHYYYRFCGVEKKEGSQPLRPCIDSVAQGFWTAGPIGRLGEICSKSPYT